jgi:outer membrane biosynthesis protein TonB
MADANQAVPRPESGDVDDVVLGLETAATLWKRGDAQDAIRWVRRAAEAAEEAGNDMRALTLARAAADLMTAEEVTPQPQPVAAPPQPQPAAAPPQPSSPLPTPTPTASAASAPGSPRPASSPSSPRPAEPVSGSAPRAANPDVAPASRRPPTPPGASASGPAQSSPRGAGAVDALSELASLARSDGAAVTRSRPTSPTALSGLRVALSRSKEQPGVLLARVLGDDEIAERGEKNGMVIATEVIVEQLLKHR